MLRCRLPFENKFVKYLIKGRFLGLTFDVEAKLDLGGVFGVAELAFEDGVVATACVEEQHCVLYFICFALKLLNYFQNLYKILSSCYLRYWLCRRISPLDWLWLSN